MNRNDQLASHLTLIKSSGCVKQAAALEETPPKYQREVRFSFMLPVKVQRQKAEGCRGNFVRGRSLHPSPSTLLMSKRTTDRLSASVLLCKSAFWVLFCLRKSWTFWSNTRLELVRPVEQVQRLRTYSHPSVPRKGRSWFRGRKRT